MIIDISDPECDVEHLCYVFRITGLPLCLTYSKITASLDRIDNSIGYCLGNVQWVHKDINTKLRREMSLVEMKKWCTIINRRQNEN